MHEGEKKILNHMKLEGVENGNNMYNSTKVMLYNALIQYDKQQHVITHGEKTDLKTPT